jgi:hypothetical protein
MSAHPFASSFTGAMCDSHSTGFDAGSLSNLPRSPVDGPYAPVVRAARTAALRRRRRRTVREMNAARTNKSKMRVTVACVSPGYNSATAEGFSNRKRCILRMECKAVSVSMGNEGENGT